MNQDPWSQSPLFGSKSEEHWVRRNATLFRPAEAASLLKALVVFFLVVVVVLPAIFVVLGPWVMVGAVWLLAILLIVRAVRKRRRN